MERKDDPAFSTPRYFRQQSDSLLSLYSRQANTFLAETAIQQTVATLSPDSQGVHTWPYSFSILRFTLLMMEIAR
jgi:hypothetical protein